MSTKPKCVLFCQFATSPAHMFGYMVIARSILAKNEASAESRIYIGRLDGPGPDWENGCQIDMEKNTGSRLVAK